MGVESFASGTYTSAELRQSECSISPFQVANGNLYSFDSSVGAWTPAATPSVARTASAAVLPCIRAATLNTLGNGQSWAARNISAKDTRLSFLCQELASLNADIVALEDVSDAALRQLTSNPFIQENYCITATPGDLGAATSVLLSRLNVVRSVTISALCEHFIRTVPALIVTVPARAAMEQACDVVVVAMQLQRATTDAERAARDDFVAHVLEGARTLQPQEHTNDIMLLGDFGLYDVADEAAITEFDLLDTWAETHFADGEDHAPGYTYDFLGNSLVQHLSAASRTQARPDRILLSAHSRLTPAGAAFLYADRPLHIISGKQSQGLAQLYLSTHFGVAIDLKVGRTLFVGNGAAKEALAAAHDRRPKFNALSRAVESAFGIAEQSRWVLSRLVSGK